MTRHGFRVLLALAGAVIITGCQGGGGSADGPAPVTAETAKMTPEQGLSEAWTYRDPDFDPRAYHKVMIEPKANVYQGPGADYGDISPEEAQKMAQMLPDETLALLRSRDYLVSEAGPGVLKLRFTVVKIDSTVPIVSTLTRIIPMSAAINLGREAMGAGGSLTGSVTIVVEAVDSQTGKSLVVTQRHVNPKTFDLESTLGTEETARAVAKRVAEDIVARMDRVAGSS